MARRFCSVHREREKCICLYVVYCTYTARRERVLSERVYYCLSGVLHELCERSRARVCERERKREREKRVMATSFLASSAAALVREVDKAPGENDVPRKYNVRKKTC